MGTRVKAGYVWRHWLNNNSIPEQQDWRNMLKLEDLPFCFVILCIYNVLAEKLFKVPSLLQLGCVNGSDLHSVQALWKEQATFSGFRCWFYERIYEDLLHSESRGFKGSFGIVQLIED